MRRVIIKGQTTNQPLSVPFWGANEAFLEATEFEHQDYSRTTFRGLISRGLIGLKVSEGSESGRGRGIGEEGGSFTIPAMTHRSA